MLYFVYELIDPRTNVVRYVGITNNPNQRYKQHLFTEDNNYHKRKWIEVLRARDLEPTIRIVETVYSEQEAQEREKYWIRYHIEAGVDLTNIRIADDIRAEKIDINISLTTLLDVYSMKTFQKFNFRVPGVQDIYQKVKSFAEDHTHQWLVMLGRDGSGKTHLAAAIGLRCIERGEDVRFISAPDILDTFAFTNTNPDRYNQLITSLHETNLLILEDLGFHNPNHKQLPALIEVLKHRFVSKLSVVITTRREVLKNIDAETMRILSDRFYHPSAAQITVTESLCGSNFALHTYRYNLPHMQDD